jgi:hypothetical protein
MGALDMLNKICYSTNRFTYLFATTSFAFELGLGWEIEEIAEECLRKELVVVNHLQI